MNIIFRSGPFGPHNDGMPRHFGFNCAGEIRPDFYDPAPWPADPHAPKPARKKVYGWAARWRRMAAELWPIDPHAPNKIRAPRNHKSFNDSLQEWREACEKAAKEPFNPAIYGEAIDSAIMDPTAAAFALDALSDKIGVSSAVKAMQGVVKEMRGTKLFTQEPGIFKRSHLKKKEQIQALDLENAVLKNQVRQLTAARNRLADQMSIMIGQDLKDQHMEFHKFQLMPGDCHPAQGTVVYAVHSDLGNVIAWHSGGSWFSRHPLGSGPARQVSEDHIKWYRKIS